MPLCFQKQSHQKCLQKKKSIEFNLFRILVQSSSLVEDAYTQRFGCKLWRQTVLHVHGNYWHHSKCFNTCILRQRCSRLCSNWLKIVKNPMGYPWDWFKSPFPWVSHGTDLSHQNPWDTHGSILRHYSWLKLLLWICTMHIVLLWDLFKSSPERVCPHHLTSSE